MQINLLGFPLQREAYIVLLSQHRDRTLPLVYENGVPIRRFQTRDRPVQDTGNKMAPKYDIMVKNLRERS